MGGMAKQPQGLREGESRAMVMLFSREECLSAAPGARRVRGRLYLPTNPQRQALPTAPARPHQRRHPRSTQAQSDRGRVCGRREGGGDEQMFGAKQQVLRVARVRRRVANERRVNQG